MVAGAAPWDREMSTALARERAAEVETATEMMIGRTEVEGAADAGTTCPVIPVTTDLLDQRTGARRVTII